MVGEQRYQDSTVKPSIFSRCCNSLTETQTVRTHKTRWQAVYPQARRRERTMANALSRSPANAYVSELRALLLDGRGAGDPHSSTHADWTKRERISLSLVRVISSGFGNYTCGELRRRNSTKFRAKSRCWLQSVFGISCMNGRTQRKLLKISLEVWIRTETLYCSVTACA